MMREARVLSSTLWNRTFKAAHVGLRVLANSFAATSVVTMLTSNQEIYMTDHIAIAKAHYSYSSALRYKLVADAVVGVFSLLSSILLYKKMKGSHTEPRTSFYFNLLIADMVMMILVISGCAAATGVGFVALKGIEEPGISWAPICNLAGKFCLMGTLSIAFSYATFACMTALTYLSAWKLKLLATHN